MNADRLNTGDLMMELNAAEARVDALETALRRLVKACTPDATSISEETGRPYGVRMPEKETVEECRTLLSTTGGG